MLANYKNDYVQHLHNRFLYLQKNIYNFFFTIIKSTINNTINIYVYNNFICFAILNRLPIVNNHLSTTSNSNGS